MNDEQKSALHPVENAAPANQESFEGKLVTGEEIKGVRWFDAVEQIERYQINFEGKEYAGKKVGAPEEWLFELL